MFGFCAIMVLMTVPLSILLESNEISDVKKDQFQIYRGHLNFTVSLMSAVRRIQPERSHFLSPHSTYHTLLLSYFGAEGETMKSLEEVLFLNWAANKMDVGNAYANLIDQSYEGIQFRSVDKVYVTNEAALNAQVQQWMGKSIEMVDFSKFEERREEINAFIKQITENEITGFLPRGAILSTTKLVLANAAFFKGFWETKFNKNQTTTKSFNGAVPTKVQMMHVTNRFEYGVDNELNAAFLKIPYAGDGEISMIVFLPLENSPTAVDDMLDASFTGSVVQDVLNSACYQLVDVNLPHISMDVEYELADVLKEMGVRNLFGKKANLKGFSNSSDLYFDDILHRAKVEIDEDGSKAAAATSTSHRISRPSAPVEPVQFHCDHPFAFIIYNHASEHVLFAGIYRGPNTTN